MKDQRLYLGHIREAIADIRTYAAAGEDAFRTDRMRQDAIIRKLEVIGEAVKQLSDDTRRQHRPSRGGRLPVCATTSPMGTSMSIWGWSGE